jgi:hypothetical protein
LLKSAKGVDCSSEAREDVGSSGARTRHIDSEQRLREARRDVHIAGWVLALLGRCRGVRFELQGPERSAISPPTRSTPAGRISIGPADLRLPGGLVPHDFLRADGEAEPSEVDRFETIRPSAIVQLADAGVGGSGIGQEGGPGAALDMILELDDRVSTRRGVAKLERYDHFLAGWSVHSRRYGQRREAEPLLVVVCRDRRLARECAQGADSTLRACRAYAGEYPFDWEYPGRERTLFVAERDMHEGLRRAYGVPRLPPSVRVIEARGDPRAGAASVEPRELP